MIPISAKKEHKKTDEKKKDKHPKQDQEVELKRKTELMMRLQAEFENFRKRTEEENTRIYSDAISDVLKKFVGVFDDFELALKNEHDKEDFRKGIELIFAKFISTAEELGLSKIKTTGEEFNPQFHEALLAEESDGPDNIILEELQAGYLLGDRVLRTAKVKVSKK